MDPFTTFSLIFIVVILLLMAEIEHRAIVAMLAAVLSVYFGVSYGLFEYKDIVEMLEIDTVLFITAVLILFETMGKSGFFDYVEKYIIERIGARPGVLAYVLPLIVTIFSGVSSNITVMLAIGMITLRIAKMLEMDARKLIIVEAVQTDVGGILLPISSVAALIVATKAKLSFSDFLKVSLPLVFVLTVVTLLYIRFFLHKELVAGGKKKADIRVGEYSNGARNPSAFYRSLVIFVSFIITISLSDMLGLSPTLISFIFVVAMFLLSGINPDEIFRGVDWSIPFFVGGFFLFVGGLEKSGVLEVVSHVVTKIVGSNLTLGMPFLLIFCAVLSAFIDNIPVTLLLLPIVENIALETGFNPIPLYWALIVGGNLGGSLTNFGSPSVFVGIRLAERKGYHVSIGEYMKTAVPLVLIQLFTALTYLMILNSLGLLQ
ncbi:MAG: hypothetical protein J7L38_06505 [Thermoproteales archaeon]|nr:hypothetical protein [Thermoproteales archaeon]